MTIINDIYMILINKNTQNIIYNPELVMTMQ